MLWSVLVTVRFSYGPFWLWDETFGSAIFVVCDSLSGNVTNILYFSYFWKFEKGEIVSLIKIWIFFVETCTDVHSGDGQTQTNNT